MLRPSGARQHVLPFWMGYQPFPIARMTSGSQEKDRKNRLFLRPGCLRIQSDQPLKQRTSDLNPRPFAHMILLREHHIERALQARARPLLAEWFIGKTSPEDLEKKAQVGPMVIEP